MTDSFFYSFPYFTLPEFPSDCKIVGNNSLFIRDILCCYKSTTWNPHIFWGGQHDPHYEHDKAPQFRMCHKNYRNKIAHMANTDYDNIYIIFRANKKYLKNNKHYLTGYYEIDQNRVEYDLDYGDYTLYAKKAVFVKDDEAINISDFLYKYNYYQIKFNSYTDGGIHHDRFMNYISMMDDMENVIIDYKKETDRINKIFKYFEFEPGVYPICNECTNQKKCPLIKRINSNGKLYDNLPPKISDIIRRHYKNIEIGACLL